MTGQEIALAIVIWGLIALGVSHSVQLHRLRRDVRSLQQIHDHEWRECFGPMAHQVSDHHAKLYGETLPTRKVRNLVPREFPK